MAYQNSCHLIFCLLTWLIDKLFQISNEPEEKKLGKGQQQVESGAQTENKYMRKGHRRKNIHYFTYKPYYPNLFFNVLGEL